MEGWQVAILLLVNKDGRSHAGIDFSDDNGDDVECTTIFSSLMGHKTASVNHELLHLFGAEDLYEEKSTGENAARAAIAKIHYPNDIMLAGSISRLELTPPMRWAGRMRRRRCVQLPNSGKAIGPVSKNYGTDSCRFGRQWYLSHLL